MVFIPALLVLFCFSTAFSQWDTYDISGTITDQFGFPVPAVTVTFHLDLSPDDDYVVSTITDGDGEYDFLLSVDDEYTEVHLCSEYPARNSAFAKLPKSI